MVLSKMKKYPKFKVCDHVRASKYKNIFLKDHTRNWSEEVFVVRIVKITAPLTYVISNLNDEETLTTFYEKERVAEDHPNRI